MSSLLIDNARAWRLYFEHCIFGVDVNRRTFDGMMTGFDDRLVRVVQPAWWQVWRWVALLCSRSRVRLEISLLGEQKLRVWAVFESRVRFPRTANRRLDRAAEQYGVTRR